MTDRMRRLVEERKICVEYLLGRELGPVELPDLFNNRDKISLEALALLPDSFLTQTYDWLKMQEDAANYVER